MLAFAGPVVDVDGAALPFSLFLVEKPKKVYEFQKYKYIGVLFSVDEIVLLINSMMTYFFAFFFNCLEDA